jgi:hypothetical protein
VGNVPPRSVEVISQTWYTYDYKIGVIKLVSYIYRVFQKEVSRKATSTVRLKGDQLMTQIMNSILLY